jgi:site-specific DNA-cytosine methylase
MSRMLDIIRKRLADDQPRPPAAQARRARPVSPRGPSGGGGLDALAVDAARDPRGRPSDAVRRWLKAHPADDERRGELLQRAREVMLAQPRRARRAHLPPTPRAVTQRSSGDHGYPMIDPGREPWLAQPLLTMEVFSGGGLLTLASALEGNIEVDDCEIEKPAVATRQRNRRLLRMEREAVAQDARTWRPATRTPHGLDMLYGGPPCKFASRASAMSRSGQERDWGAKDNFFPQVLDWICDLQPRVGAFENAPTLVETPRYREFMRQWQEQLRLIGYDSALHLLAAADFGNPTMRRRAIVFAWPAGAPWGEHLRRKPDGMFAEPGTQAVLRGDKMPWKPSIDRLTSGCCSGWGLVDCVFLGGFGLECRGCGNGRNFAPAPNTDGDHGRRSFRGQTIKIERGRRRGQRIPWHEWIKENVGARQPRFDKFVPADLSGAWVSMKTGARDLRVPGRRLSEYLSRTVVPNFFNKAEGLIIPADAPAKRYSGSRDWDQAMLEAMSGMSVRDVAKLQDVPQWYGIEGTRVQAIKQLGNGVPINLGRGVMAHVRMAMGLPVRAPWWETEVPMSSHGPRFQTRAQISAAGDRPTRPGEGAGHPDGLWPTEAFAMCYAVPPPLIHGLVLDEWVEDDWDQMLQGGIIGTQEQRRSGHSKLDRGARLLPADAQLRQVRGLAQQTREIFTPDGLDREALWGAGYRGPPDAPPDQMPFAYSRHIDATGEWSDALVYSDGGPWATLLGVWLRLVYPEIMYEDDDGDWLRLFTIEADLPKLDAATRAEFEGAGVEIPTARTLGRLRRRDMISKATRR